jgi:GntR family transcriptional regulator, histidine utilization repressor
MAAIGDETSETLHRRILADIEERILSGAWRPGDRIPSEHELATRYRCSRMTVNKALTQLARAGYVERRRRAGTFVRQPQAQAAVLEIHTVESEVAALGLAYGYERLDQRVRPAGPHAARMEVDNASPLLEVRCLHHAGGEPFCLEERLIGLEVVPAARGADFEMEPPSAWLLRQVPWRIAEHTIGAGAASAEVATRLGIAEGTACLTVDRRTWDADGVVTWVRLTYPAGRHRLIARFAPSESR